LKTEIPAAKHRIFAIKGRTFFMLLSDIQGELLRLQIHPVNLEALADDGTNIALKGSLLAFWPVPRLVDGRWFLEVLKNLEANSGPKATMDAFCAANAQNG
jgi:hypothetical protein